MKCWQRVIKERLCTPEDARRRDSYVNKNNLRISELKYSIAKDFIEKYEWLGNIGSAKYCYGLHVYDELVAVVCFTTPSSPSAFAKLLGDANARHTYQLCRGASSPSCPKWGASKLISCSMKLLRIKTSARVVVCYADPEAGEIGTVYQASNAYYIGMTSYTGPSAYIINGIKYHARSVPKRFGSAKHDVLFELDNDYSRIQRTKKHRYVYILDRSINGKHIKISLEHLIKEYPKRADSVLPPQA